MENINKRPVDWYETPTDTARVYLETLFAAMEEFYSFAGSAYPVKTLDTLISSLALEMHEADDYNKETIILIQSLSAMMAFISSVGEVHSKLEHLADINKLSTSTKP